MELTRRNEYKQKKNELEEILSTKVSPQYKKLLEEFEKSLWYHSPQSLPHSTNIPPAKLTDPMLILALKTKSIMETKKPGDYPVERASCCQLAEFVGN
ncbi:hypothetical protein CRE_25837 [Caenorhabditis remanei]|uniref:Uncharacterized protein n=1 Tax=Caenorhabditis remanei TaxID=31234 RepID=E3NA89_CAERE|nr:hypothetical protein CRE_25837 [Caenorhabditis remanei]